VSFLKASDKVLLFATIQQLYLSLLDAAREKEDCGHPFFPLLYLFSD
jgi:hypothetical protein